ncbi:MAG: hypothetical protein ACHREM_21575, partial [Polyangiales bacterium]
SEDSTQYLGAEAYLAERLGQKSAAAQLWQRVADAHPENRGAAEHARALRDAVDKSTHEHDLETPKPAPP